jgi:hypothetical protein
LSVLIQIFPVAELTARDYLITGRVTDPDGTLIPNAKVSFVAGTREYAATSRPDGFYSVRISGIYDNISGLIETGIPYPNPFSNSVNVPFIINNKGDIRFTVYNFRAENKRLLILQLNGQLSDRWDGCSQNGDHSLRALYLRNYFHRKDKIRKLIKAAGFSSYQQELLSNLSSPVTPPPAESSSPVITSVTCQDYYSDY